MSNLAAHQHEEPLAPLGSFHNDYDQLNPNAKPQGIYVNSTSGFAVDCSPAGCYPQSAAGYKAIGASPWNCRRIGCLKIIEHIVTGVCIYIIFTPSIMTEIRWMVGLPYVLYSLFIVVVVLVPYISCGLCTGISVDYIRPGSDGSVAPRHSVRKVCNSSEDLGQPFSNPGDDMHKCIGVLNRVIIPCLNFQPEGSREIVVKYNVDHLVDPTQPVETSISMTGGGGKGTDSPFVVNHAPRVPEVVVLRPMNV